MLEDEILQLLSEVRSGAVSEEEALRRLRRGPFREADLGFAKPDLHRRMRHGLNEVVFGETKPIDQILAIADELSRQGGPVLITRLQPEKIAALAGRFPGGRASARGRTFILNPPPLRTASAREPHVAVVSAGTSDLPVSDEACEVCVAMDTAFVSVCDVGVAGLHRILDKVGVLQTASALVVVAGMEGALPSVVAGLAPGPVFAVPTSVGYGVGFAGLTPLLAMMNSCAPGVTVSNIDNGFSAAYAACQVVRAVRAAKGSAP